LYATAVLDFVSQSWKAEIHDATLRLAQLITDGGSQSSWWGKVGLENDKNTDVYTIQEYVNISLG